MSSTHDTPAVTLGRHKDDNERGVIENMPGDHTRGRSSRAMVLSVWANLKDKHAKVLNNEWRGDTVEVVSFRRSEWASELLAIGRVIPMH
jgi:hypothetical protein